MTTPAQDSPLTTALEIFADDPLEDGDAVLFLDDAVCMKVAGLADHWDDVMIVRTAEILEQKASTVTLAIARLQARLRDSDYQIWRDLHAALRSTDIAFGPVRALPAA